MKLPSQVSPIKIVKFLSICSVSILLIACGGGGGADAGSLSVQAPSLPAASPVVIPPVVTPPVVTPPVVTPPVVTPPVSSPVTLPPVVTPPVSGGDAIITYVRIQNTDTVSRTQTSIPLTFGHIFAQGDLPNANALYGKLSDGTAVPLQVDVKAKHADGSVRHAIISAALPSLPFNQAAAIFLVKSPKLTTPATGISPATLLASGFTAALNVSINGQIYSASADTLLKGTTYKSWLAGPLVNEWLVSAPLKNAQGVEHPQLTARFAIRSYTGLGKARVDMTIENGWAWDPNPQDIVYNAQMLVGGQSVYSKSGMTHYNHARWRKTFWWGTEPQVHIIHNTPYLIASKAVPNYDQSFNTPQYWLTALKTQFSGAVTEPMANGMAEKYMPLTGGRPDIGLIPSWATTYLLSMDKGVKDATLGTADLGGSWSIHYRDKNTDRPISVVDYPYATLNNRVEYINPATKKSELLPTVAVVSNPNTPDSSHEPGFAYLPYLVTGDYYYLEELQFWNMYNIVQWGSGYREHEQGLISPDQVRGQAWSLRTLGETGYITPDSDPLKGQYVQYVNNNLDWYNTQYTNNSNANALGIIVNGFALAERAMAPWQDDFFTSAVGHLAELGFSKAVPLLTWQAKFPIGRMTAPGYCWIDASVYNLNVRDSATSPLYTTFQQAYLGTEATGFTSLACGSAAMGVFLGLRQGEMVGYASSNTGFPSNLQPALAYGATSGASGGQNAWNIFMARSVKPDYSTGPQFAIIPR